MRVIVEDGEVLSHAAIYYSKVRTHDFTHSVGGVGSVATHPEYRGRGLATEVLKDCINVMRESGCHLSVLWTQRRDFYRRLGYEAAGSEFLVRARMEDFVGIPCDCSIVEYAPEHLPDIIRIHEQEPLRTERTLQEYEAYLGIPNVEALLAMRVNKITAYAVMGKGEDFHCCVHEWGGEVADLLCLVREFARRATSGHVTILLPASETPLVHLLRRMRLPAVFEYLAMMKVINLEGVSSAVGDYVSARTGREFQIRRRGEGFSVCLGKEDVTLDDERKLVRLLFGPDAPSSVVTGFSSRILHALDACFPIPLFIWGLDSV